jgi:hypothetical protein
MERLVRTGGPPIDKEYYEWLCSLIECNGFNKRSYWLLSRALYEKEFTWTVPNDDNRAYEGRNLRERFCDEQGIEYDFDAFPEGVSMLELIIGLAYRCESIMADSESEGEMVEWFWKILENIGLDRFDDEVFYAEKGHLVVDEILEKVINRTYHSSGKGGLFPLKHAEKDQTEVELWYQMNTYLVENYYKDEEVI